MYIVNFLYSGRPKRRTRNPFPQYSRYGGSESYSRRTTTTTTTTPSPAPEGQRRKRKLRRAAPPSENLFPVEESAAVEERSLEDPWFLKFSPSTRSLSQRG